MAQTVKRLPTMRETRVQSLGWEGLLEKEMTTRSSILTGKCQGQRSLVGYSPWGCKELDTTERLHFHLLFGKKVKTKLDSILKSREITLSTKVCLVKAMVFPVIMYGCESWTIKKAEYRRIDAFKLWYWKTLLRVSWTERRSNQSILKEIYPEYSLEEQILKLKLQYFGHLM